VDDSGDINLVNNFISKWTAKEKEPSALSKIKNIAKPQENLKEQITMVTQRLDAQTRTLDAAVQRFEIRDSDIFQRVVKAMTERDSARANILATELGEIRKVKKMLSQASLALQSVSMRLSTVSEIGDVVAVLSPAKNLLNNVRSEMCSIFPEASQELGNIGNLLSDIVTTTNQGSDMPVNTIMANADALQILEEAEVAAENRLREKIPDPEMSIPSNKRASLEALR
jgi:division protein CdvB (Snf7/Vps24/ESCRT-III family)